MKLELKHLAPYLPFKMKYKNTKNDKIYTVLPTDKKGVADVGSKICTKCNTNKNINEFSFVYGRKRKDGTKKGRYHSQCKICRKSVLKNWRNKNPEYSKEASKEWRENNPDKKREYDLNYKKQNIVRVRKWKRNWDLKNRHKYKIYKAKQPKEKIRLWQRKTDKKLRERLADSYVVGILCAKNNLKAIDIRKYPELIKTKRLIIKTSRLCRTS
jgi:hypothetical protein